MADIPDQNDEQYEPQDDINQDAMMQIQPMQEDEGDEDDDFPEYANEQNKQLNEIIKEKRRLIRDITRKIEEKSDRAKVLGDHLKNVQQELLHTQALIDAKNKEIETEDHLKQVGERQIGRIESEYRKLDKAAIEQQEKLNDVQNHIFRGNEKMDQYKLEMNWNQEELEQWALAARQKEEDNLTLEKYKRADEVKIKELNLQIERLTSETGRKQAELEKEITETQASQIELDKTAEEFKNQHEERHKLFLQWQEVTEVISRRDGAIRVEGENFAKIKMDINQNRDALEDRKDILKKDKDENRATDMRIQLLERQNIAQISENKSIEENIYEKKADVEILKNQVSAFASDLANKRNRISVLSQDLLVKKQRLNAAQKKYNAHQIKLSNEALEAKKFENDREAADERFKESEKERNALEKDIRTEEKNLVKQTSELFDLRSREAFLYGEIQNNMSACRNLQSHINSLNQEFQRQQELLYNAEYQIQLMERKVNRARGERTLEERNDLNKEIAIAKEEYEVEKEDMKTLSESLKKLEEELMMVEKKSASIESERKQCQAIIEELELENDMTWQDLNKIVKQKEEVLVYHDCMKLDIKKISEHLSGANDTVSHLENRKYQLEMSMEEREKEIQVHRDVLLTEHKAAEEERHKIAVELAERRNKVKNLKIKYESLVQKNKASNGESESVHEHSQAYYVIKAAQEREELQRKADELNAKILKSEKELKALDNTLSHLRNRNSKYRDGFLNKGVTQEIRDSKDALDDQCSAASENLFKKRNELQKLENEYKEDYRRLSEINNKVEILESQERQIQQIQAKVQSEILYQQEKEKRAEVQLSKAYEMAQKHNVPDSEENIHIASFKYENAQVFSKTLITGLYNLASDIPELSGIIEEVMKEKNLFLPEKAPSSVALGTNYSIKSTSSRGSQGRR